MPRVLTPAAKAARVKWDRENMTTVGCRISRRKALEFRAACALLETVPNQVFLKAIDETIKKASKKSSD